MSTHYNGSDTEKLVLDTWIKLSRAKESIGRVLRQHLEQQNITFTQFGVMEILEHRGPLSLKEIGNKILLTSSNLVTVIDNLEKHGLVTRKKNKQDRRSIIIQLTPKGADTLQPIFQSHLSELMDRFDILTVEEQKTLGIICKKLGLNQKEQLQ
ncbi:MarR family transcriptional regulator [bacterium]|nr:MarR family transcriptional regulator [bacterium]